MRIAFDIIGDIAIVEDSGINKEVLVEEIKKRHKRIKAIYLKSSKRKGEFRTRTIKLIFGDIYETIHKEYSCIFKLDVRNVYFSPREAFERSRIVNLVNNGERILVMFAGIGPFAIRIAKEKFVDVFAIEKNEIAFKYMIENIMLNKLKGNIHPVFGDVKNKAKNFYKKMNRVLMPLPKGAHRFLREGIRCAKNKGVVHFYHWAHEKDLFTEAIKIIKKNCEKEIVDFEILEKRKVLPYAPRIYKVCIEFRVLR